MNKILEILTTEYKSEYYFTMSEKQYLKPKIYHGGKSFDLSKRWYVYYSYMNPKTGVMTRQAPIYMNINRDFKTKNERLKALEKIRKNLEELLKKGYSPYTIEEDSNFTIKSCLTWALELKKKTLSDSSYKDYEHRTNKFIAYLEKAGNDFIPANEFPKRIALEYLNEILSKNSAKSFNNTRLVLSSLFTLMKENDYVEKNIIEDIKPQKTNPLRHKTYSDNQLEKLFELINKDRQMLLFIQFVSYNFLRPIEVVRLKFEDLKTDQSPAYLEFRAKNKPLKIKLIPEIMLNELKNLDSSNETGFIFQTNEKGIDTKEINRRDFFTKKFAKIKDQLNLGEEYTIYSFRHTFITKLFREIRKKKNLLETYDILMKITGHATLDALKKYLRDIDAELAEDYSEFLK